LLFFAIPIIGAFWLFQHPKNFSLKTVNHGQLIQPLLKIQQLSLKTDTGNAFDNQTWQDHWVIAYIDPQSTCTTTCQHILYNLRQIRLALGKNQQQVLRAYITLNQASSPETQQLLTHQYLGTVALHTSLAALSQFLPESFKAETLKTGQIVIIDPAAYVMMRYPTNVNAKDVLADLTRLLQVN
jgi:cytochrome oxidase Cu insertion factor (SCO1/SenC/PrrC family)